MRALITGILGQDGSYMAELLHSKGYEVYGIVKVNSNYTKMSLLPNGTEISGFDILDKGRLQKEIEEIKPNEIYNFAGVSNVFNPLEDLDHTLNLNAKVPQNILEIIYKVDKSIKFFQASSCLIFGNDTYGMQDENTPCNPIHPYGASKLYADNIVKEFRKKGVYACSGIFFNHESKRRGENFFSKRITREVKEVKEFKRDKIKVGNLSSLRDMGYAPDFMEAAYLMMHNSEPKDYVIGTGKLISMRDFVVKCLELKGLDYNTHIEADPSLYRANDTRVLKANITKIKRDLGWEPKHNIDDIIKIMME